MRSTVGGVGAVGMLGVLALIFGGCEAGQATVTDESWDEDDLGVAADELITITTPGGTTSGDCYSNNAQVSQLSITGSSVSSSSLSFSVNGNWQVSGASGIVLEYSLNGGSPFQIDQTTSYGTTGTFSVPGALPACGQHTFKVCGYPKIGASTTCPSKKICTTTTLNKPCAPPPVSATLQCNPVVPPDPDATCHASGSGGTGTLTPYWRITTFPNSGGAPSVGSWGLGGWDYTYSCKYFTLKGYSTKVELQVFDSTGAASPVQSYSCGTTDEWQ